MDEVPDARTIPEPTVAEMVRSVDPGLELRAADPVERGFCSVSRLAVEDDGQRRELYLKASPDGEPWAIPTEARIQSVLAAHTSVPVPEVLGVVDEDPELPAPYYLMSARPGEALPYEAVGRLADSSLERLAEGTGEYLGELHSVGAVDAFGHVRHRDADRSGTAPPGDPGVLTVGEPREDWPGYLRERVEAELDRHGDSRFSELTPELERWFRAGIADLEGPFDPVLGRNDHGLHNLLVDPDDGSVTAVLDWGYTLAVPAAFDVEFAAYLYGGSFLAGLSDVRDRRDLVREAMLAGYRRTAPELSERVSTPRPLYEALAAVRIMNDFDSLTLPAGTERAVADHVRAEVRTLIDRRGPDV